MPSSMTGFGRAVIDAPFGHLTVEVQSVNRKYLEVFIALPKELGRFESEVRKWVGEHVSRGQVSVRVFLTPSEDLLEGLLPDPQMLKNLKKGWEKIAKEIGSDPKSIDLPFLMQHMPVLPRQDMTDEKDLPSLRSCIEKALESLVKMKNTEGKTLAKDLAERLKELESLISQIATHAPSATAKMRQKLMEKMSEVLKMSTECEERLLREVAIFAERVDVTEEIIRFKSHIEQFKEILKGDVVGRKMDFLIQEMGREVNTIGSKSMEVAMSRLVVEMKSEMEKMREQVQNLE